MHESSLAKQILDAALGAVPPHARVTVVRGRVAETESLSRDALALHFGAHARGTAAEGARLALELTHVRARCAACNAVYLPEHHVLLCPDCGATEAEVLGETGLFIDDIDVETS